jgi:sortase (surface protein transpeptidase)
MAKDSAHNTKVTDASLSSKRRHARMAAFGVLGVSCGMITALFAQTVYETQVWMPNIGAEHAGVEDTESASQSTDVLEASAPVRIRIPTLDLEARFEDELGLNEDDTVEVPEGFDTVGWYKHGPTPGERGPAVVLGHVDSYRGPAVFYSLGQLRLGDDILIEREDGTTANFVVTGLDRYSRDSFRTDLVYGDIDHAGLRLVTCSGTFDRGKQVYSHNLVVYATLAAPATPDTISEL